MSITLYELDRNIEEILDTMIDPETGEVDEEKLKELNELQMGRNEKIESCILFAKSEKADAEAILKEIDNLKARANAKLNRAENTLRYVEASLKGEKFETDRCAVTYRKSQSVEIVDLDLLPDKYCVFKTEKKPVKKEIKQLLRENIAVPGATLVDHNNMVVK